MTALPVIGRSCRVWLRRAQRRSQRQPWAELWNVRSPLKVTEQAAQCVHYSIKGGQAFHLLISWTSLGTEEHRFSLDSAVEGGCDQIKVQ